MVRSPWFAASLCTLIPRIADRRSAPPRCFERRREASRWTEDVVVDVAFDAWSMGVDDTVSMAGGDGPHPAVSIGPFA